MLMLLAYNIATVLLYILKKETCVFSMSQQCGTDKKRHSKAVGRLEGFILVITRVSPIVMKNLSTASREPRAARELPIFLESVIGLPTKAPTKIKPTPSWSFLSLVHFWVHERRPSCFSPGLYPRKDNTRTCRYRRLRLKSLIPQSHHRLSFGLVCATLRKSHAREDGSVNNRVTLWSTTAHVGSHLGQLLKENTKSIHSGKH
jgi:hypothetical protein